ncbi:hypothetical protein GQX74_008934 [Glossina fuscipes]|nr:hypothetical protein GQX74_008934 [Glossina fuscipes]
MRLDMSKDQKASAIIDSLKWQLPFTKDLEPGQYNQSLAKHFEIFSDAGIANYQNEKIENGKSFKRSVYSIFRLRSLIKARKSSSLKWHCMIVLLSCTILYSLLPLALPMPLPPVAAPIPAEVVAVPILEEPPQLPVAAIAPVMRRCRRGRGAPTAVAAATDEEDVEVVLAVEIRDLISYSASLLLSDGQLNPFSSSSSTVACEYA